MGMGAECRSDWGGNERARREDGCPIINVGNDVSTSGESRESDFAETWVVHLGYRSFAGAQDDNAGE